MRVGLISCCKEKLNHVAPAQELYCSSYFKLSKAWITKRVDQWGILSAEHGLIMPDQVIEPYDRALTDLSRLHKERWVDYVHEQLVKKWSEQAIWLVVAGAEYRAALKYMPCVEDVIGYWTGQRKQNGMSGRKSMMGIGVIKKYLKEDRAYGC